MKLTFFANVPIGSGYWCVSKANKAVNEHKPAVNRMKNGNSFLGYTETSWNATIKSKKMTIIQHNFN